MHSHCLTNRLPSKSGLKYIFPVVAGLLFVSSSLNAQVFERVTSETGLNIQLLSNTGTNGVSVADYNNDGNLDVYFVLTASYAPGNKGTWNRLLSANGDGTFQDRSSQNRIAGGGSGIEASYMGQKMGASWGDFDNDGYPDLFLTHAGPDRLLHNNGDGSFTDITGEAGVAGGETQFSSNALWFDFDTDGDLDLFVAVWEDYADTLRDQQNHLYENLGGGNFTEVTEAAGLTDKSDTWMAVAVDLNGDGYLDLYLANDFGENIFYLNNGDKTFTDRTGSFGLNNRFEGMGVTIGDANGDGLFDIYLTNATEKPHNPEQINPLFINTGQDSMINKSVEAGVELAGWGWETTFLDYDNDGDEDLFVVNGYFQSAIEANRFFINTDSENLAFEESAEELGLADTEESRSFVAFDYNDDGRQDLLISNFSNGPFLYKNNTEPKSWLKITLEGTETNRNGFGSVVQVEAGGKTYRKYHHGAHFYGQNILPVHFGLGEASSVDKISVFWLNGHVDEIEDVEINQSIYIKEKTGIVTSTEEEAQPRIPGGIRLIGNYPNPFNNATQIQFDLDQPGKATLEIFNVLGQLVHSFQEDFNHAGRQTIHWNTNNKQQLNTGLYLYRVKSAGSLSRMSKMVYLK